MTRTEVLSPAMVEVAVALFLDQIRGVPLRAVKAVRFPVYDAKGNPQLIAEVDEDVERQDRSVGVGAGRVPEVADSDAGGGI